MAPYDFPPCWSCAIYFPNGIIFGGVKEVCFSQSLSNRFMCEIGATIPNLKVEIISEIMLEIHKLKLPVDGRNPAPPGICKTLQIMG